MAGDWHENIVNLIQDRPVFAAELIGIADDQSYGDIEVGHSEFTDRYLNKGREQGHEQGREQGLTNSREALVRICEARSIELGAAERALIEECDDFGQLQQWLVQAATADDAAAVFEV